MDDVEQQLIKWHAKERIESTNRCKEASLSKGWASAEGAKLQAQNNPNKNPANQAQRVHVCTSAEG